MTLLRYRDDLDFILIEDVKLFGYNLDWIG